MPAFACIKVDPVGCYFYRSNFPGEGPWPKDFRLMAHGSAWDFRVERIEERVHFDGYAGQKVDLLWVTPAKLWPEDLSVFILSDEIHWTPMNYFSDPPPATVVPLQLRP